MVPFATATGVVAEFDDHAGRGVVRGDDGHDLYFHCTRIADGSRTIPVGIAVTYEVVPGPTRAWEAVAVRPTAPAPPA